MSKRVTAAELMVRLKADPEWVAAREREERERERKAAEWRRAEAPVAEELRAAGYAVESAWDLMNTAEPYPEAVPILLKHLERPYPDRVREGIARALAVDEARYGWDSLKRLYQKEPTGTDAKDGLAVALGEVADDEVIGDVIALARDARHGTSRLLLLSALERSQDPRARKTLMELGSDPEVYKEVQVILKRLKRRRARRQTLGEWKRVLSAEKHLDQRQSAATPLPTSAGEGLAEASTNLDLELLGPFIERVSSLVTGFGTAEVAEALEVFEDLEMKEERERAFQVQYGGETMPLVVRIFKSDEDAPDIAFFAPPSLVEEINKLMEAFCEEHGI